jgi:hypothetical protein
MWQAFYIKSGNFFSSTSRTKAQKEIGHQNTLTPDKQKYWLVVKGWVIS